MPSPQSGNAGSAVSPADPDPALDADDAIAGSVDQTQANPATTTPGTYDTSQFKPYKKNPLKKSWIEIKLVDEQKNPVPGEPYSVILPDSTVATGTLDDKGFARIDGIDPGTCQITFPQRDTEAWKKV